MSFAIWAFRIILLLLIIRFLMRLFARRPVAAGRPPRGPHAAQERLGGTLVRDPHCGTYVPQTRALALGTGSSAVYFCSTGCRDAWAAVHRT
jgi:hypothetical protein